MKRWQVAALGAVMCSGCLEPMVKDDPGYSRYVLPPGSPVASAYEDLQISRKIDKEDGLTPPVKLKSGWAGGQAVKYWDLGAAKRNAPPAYALTTCANGAPEPNAPLTRWPFIVETIPGDTDYSPFRAVSWVCVTDKYHDEIISSSDALNDAIDLGLVLEPRPADIWVNVPIVAQNVELEWPAGNRVPQAAYYKGMTLGVLAFDDQEGRFPYDPMKGVPAANVYDIVKSGQSGVVRTIFSQPYFMSEQDRTRNPAYSPQWMLYTVTLRPLTVPEGSTLEAEQAKENADIEMWVKDTDIVMVSPMGGAPKEKHPRVLSVVASMTTARVNRPFALEGAAP